MKIRPMIAFLLLGTILSACGTNTSDTSNSTGDSSAPATSEAPASNSEVITSDETSNSIPETSQDPVVSPSIELTLADPYDGDHWDGLNLELEGQALRDHLNEFMWARFKKVSYGTVATMVRLMDEDPKNKSNILSIYDLNSIPKSSGSWNREHTFPQSKLADGDPELRVDQGKDTNISSDAANIFASDHYLNTQRSNYSFMDLDYSEKYYGSTLYNSFGTRTDNFIYRGYFVPTAKVRGEIARAQLYMLVMYPDNCSPAENFTLAHMLKWNMQYLPTVERDMQRNAVLEAYQKVRNPFIDMPELGCKIFGHMDASTEKVCYPA